MNKSLFTPEERLKEMEQLPDHFLVYFMVEIEMMISEQGCLKFEEREPGCLRAFFEGFSKVFENLKEVNISHEMIKTLHRINTNTKTVKIQGIDDHTSGEYRMEDVVEKIELTSENISFAGIKRLIHLIDRDEIPGLMIGSTEEYDKVYRYSSDIALYGRMIEILKFINQSTDLLKGDMVDLINQHLLDKKLMLNTGNKLTEKEIVKNHFCSTYTLLALRQILNMSLNDDRDTRITDIVLELKTANDLKSIVKLLKNPLCGNAIDQVCDLFKEKIVKNKIFIEKSRVLLLSNDSIGEVRKAFNVANDNELAGLLMKKITNDGLTIRFANGLYLKKLMDALIENFNKEMNALKNENHDKKLLTIFSYVQLFLLAHPFVDANNRTFVNQLANRLLIQHGFPPAIYFNPFVFYACAPHEIIDAVKLSCANYLVMIEYVTLGKNKYFDFQDNALSKSYKEKTKFFTRPYRDFMKEKNTAKKTDHPDTVTLFSKNRPLAKNDKPTQAVDCCNFGSHR